MRNIYNPLFMLSMILVIISLAFTTYDIIILYAFDKPLSYSWLVTIIMVFVMVIFAALAAHKENKISEENYSAYKQSTKK